jgi:apolipoprotein N-acyltransferase
MGVVDAALPRALTPTPYARYGDMIFAILLGSAAAAAFFMSRKESR